MYTVFSFVPPQDILDFRQAQFFRHNFFCAKIFVPVLGTFFLKLKKMCRSINEKIALQGTLSVKDDWYS